MGYQNWWNYSGNGRTNFQQPEVKFMESYVSNFDFEKSLSFESFDWEALKQIKSNSSLRKIYDSYLDIFNNGKIHEQKEIQIKILLAKIGYQEKRPNSKLAPWFFKFISSIYDKIPWKNGTEEKHQNFRDFLEVFVAYHKYYKPKDN